MKPIAYTVPLVRLCPAENGAVSAVPDVAPTTAGPISTRAAPGESGVVGREETWNSFVSLTTLQTAVKFAAMFHVIASSEYWRSKLVGAVAVELPIVIATSAMVVVMPRP